MRSIRYRMKSLLHLFVFLYLTTIAADVFARHETIQDANGNTVSISAPYKRIISLYSAHTENLCSMGAQNLLVGISRTDDFPQSILHKTRFSYREDSEKFIARRPDLVLIRPMIERSYPQFIEKLRQAKIKVISLQPNSIEKMFDYWKTLAILCGREKEAEAMIAGFKDRINRVQNKLNTFENLQRPKVYFQSIHSKSKTFAPQSIGIFVLEQAGGINIGADAQQVRKTNIAYYGKERLLAKGSKIDIFLAQVGRMNPITRDIIMNEPGYQAIKAVREERVHLIEEQLVSRPTLRIAKGIEKLFDIFFPHPTQRTQTP